MKNSYTDSLAHTTYDCKYHIVFAPKFRRKVKSIYKNITKNSYYIKGYCKTKGNLV